MGKGDQRRACQFLLIVVIPRKNQWGLAGGKGSMQPYIVHSKWLEGMLCACFP